jgi:predicted RNase H-like nuclease
VHYLGVDLAWGTRNPSGVAALDADGILLDLARAVSDDDIVAWLTPYSGQVPGDACHVGIDAPIVVPNASGLRDCERLVGRYFGRFGASCHPANTAMPAFSAGTRAQRLLDVLDLEGDPAGTGPHRAFEVYPHQAAVMLFGLTTVLRYKSKPGRDLNGMRAELLRLMTLLEALADHEVPLDVAVCPGWRRLRDAVRLAGTKAALRRCEDPVDAVLCAYVVRYAHARPGRVRVLGDHLGGHVLCVVSPELAARVDEDLARVE